MFRYKVLQMSILHCVFIDYLECLKLEKLNFSNKNACATMCDIFRLTLALQNLKFCLLLVYNIIVEL